jgi:hypothetical protein
MGYFQTSTEHNELHVRRRVYAPAGDTPAVLADVEIANTSDQARDITYYEYWDVNIQQVPFQAFRSGTFGATGDAERRKLNREFTPCIVWDEPSRALRFHFHPPAAASAPHIPSHTNWRPPDIFMADLSGQPDAVYTDKHTFFGQGGAEHPDAIGRVESMGVRRIPKTIMPYCMVIQRNVQIPASGSVHLRFAYGIVDPDDTLDCRSDYPDGQAPHPLPAEWHQCYQDKLANAASFAELQGHWRDKLAYFSTAGFPHVQREMAWHAYYLQSSALYSTYFDTRIVPQGSAYLYLQGLEGAPRDFALYVLPLTYLNPPLARDLLCLIMRMTSGASGQIAYSFTGNGLLSGALVHHLPSDFDLFFLLAITEYLAVTGDASFLDQQVGYYHGHNQPASHTVLDHMLLALRHLLEDVGIGASQLLRVRDGDWSDDVVLRNIFPFAPLTSPNLTIEHGESIPNSQMALYVLPRVLRLLEQHKPAAAERIAEAIDQTIETLQAGLRAQWRGRFYSRAILRYWGNAKRTLHGDKLNLEAQVWALISDFEPDKIEALKNSVFDELDGPSPLGATMMNGAIWPAVAQLLTWGYARRFPDLAWRSFLNQTFANKAELYGHSWLNIWSGPDGLNGAKMAEPGGTYNTAPVTPMIDFPIMNNNQHAMALLALLRVCGIEPAASGDGLRITPQVPNHYAIDTPLIKLTVAPQHIAGEYRAQTSGQSKLHIRLPQPADQVQTKVAGEVEVQTPDADGYVTIKLPPYNPGECITFEVSPG